MAEELVFYQMELIDKNPYLWEILVYNANVELFLDEIFYGQAAANGFSRCLRCMGYENRSDEMEYK